MNERAWICQFSAVRENLDADALVIYSGESLFLFQANPDNRDFPSTLDPKDPVVREILKAEKSFSADKSHFGKEFAKFPNKHLIASPLKYGKKTIGLLVAVKSRKPSQRHLRLLAEDANRFSTWLAILDLESEKKTLQEKVISVEKKLETAYQRILESGKLATLGRFAGGLAHELNTPLGAIQTYAEYLQLFIKGETEKESLEGIVKAISHCKEIIENVLRLSREGKQNFQIIDLKDVIHDALLLTSPEMEKKRVQVASELAGNLEPILGDHTRLVQVVTNLLSNARDAILRQRFIPRESRIKISLFPEGRFNIIEISDNGPGIPEEILGKIFDPFFTTKEVGQGTGLGLSICNAIVEEHQGKLEVESRDGKGTRVLVKIPVKSEKEEDPHVQALNRGR